VWSGADQGDRAQVGLALHGPDQVDRGVEREEVRALREPGGDLDVQALGDLDEVAVGVHRLLHRRERRGGLAGGDVGRGLAELVDQVRGGRERQHHDQHEGGRELELEGQASGAGHERSR